MKLEKYTHNFSTVCTV